MVHKIESEICIGANKHTRLGMTNKITTGQAYAPSGPPLNPPLPIRDQCDAMKCTCGAYGI